MLAIRLPNVAASPRKNFLQPLLDAPYSTIFHIHPVSSNPFSLKMIPHSLLLVQYFSCLFGCTLWFKLWLAATIGEGIIDIILQVYLSKVLSVWYYFLNWPKPLFLLMLCWLSMNASSSTFACTRLSSSYSSWRFYAHNVLSLIYISSQAKILSQFLFYTMHC